MSRRHPNAITILITLGAAALALAPAVGAQAEDIPRTADGKPDLSGVYNIATLTPLSRPAKYGDNLFLTAEQAKAIEEEEQAFLAKANEQSDPNRDAPSDEGAAPVGFDDSQRENLGAGNVGGYNNHKRIVQTRGHVMILVEMNHDARIIRLNSEHDDSGVRKWLGDSNGWWEGDTLVVSTRNFGDRPGLGSASRDLHVTERFTRLDADTLHYEFTVEVYVGQDLRSGWEGCLGGPLSTSSPGCFFFECGDRASALPRRLWLRWQRQGGLPRSRWSVGLRGELSDGRLGKASASAVLLRVLRG